MKNYGSSTGVWRQRGRVLISLASPALLHLTTAHRNFKIIPVLREYFLGYESDGGEGSKKKD